MKRSREWLAAAVLAVGGMLFALSMLEVGVRALHLLPDQFWEPDPVLGARLTPGKSGWWTQEEREFLTPVQINSLGRRDAERGYERKTAVSRILVLGDSFVEALQVPFEEAFPHRLEGQLDHDGHRVEVINGGVSGYGTAGSTLLFETEGIKYRPDLVLLAFYPGNDVRNNSPALEDTLRPVYAEDATLQRVEKIGSGGARGEGWSSKSAAYRYVRKLVLTRQPALAKVLADLGLMKPEAVRQTAEEDGIPVAYGVYADPLDADWEDAWKRTYGLLARLRRDVEQTGAKFMVAVVTTRERIYTDTWEEILATHPAMRTRRWDLEAPQRRLMSWCAGAGVPCLELETAFVTARGDSSEPLHYRYDGHWTAAGHAVAASALKEFIEGQQLLPAESGGRVQ